MIGGEDVRHDEGLRSYLAEEWGCDHAAVVALALVGAQDHDRDGELGLVDGQIAGEAGEILVLILAGLVAEELGGSRLAGDPEAGDAGVGASAGLARDRLEHERHLHRGLFGHGLGADLGRDDTRRPLMRPELLDEHGPHQLAAVGDGCRGKVDLQRRGREAVAIRECRVLHFAPGRGAQNAARFAAEAEPGVEAETKRAEIVVVILLRDLEPHLQRANVGAVLDDLPDRDDARFVGVFHRVATDVVGAHVAVDERVGGDEALVDGGRDGHDLGR